MAPPALLQPPAPRPDPTAAPSSRPKRRRPLAPLLMLAAAAGSLVGGAAAARAPRIASVPPPGARVGLLYVGCCVHAFHAFLQIAGASEPTCAHALTHKRTNTHRPLPIARIPRAPAAAATTTGLPLLPVSAAAAAATRGRLPSAALPPAAATAAAGGALSRLPPTPAACVLRGAAAAAAAGAATGLTGTNKPMPGISIKPTGSKRGRSAYIYAHAHQRFKTGAFNLSLHACT